jgi:uncharacterized protein (TIGR03086 family)
METWLGTKPSAWFRPVGECPVRLDEDALRLMDVGLDLAGRAPVHSLDVDCAEREHWDVTIVSGLTPTNGRSMPNPDLHPAADRMIRLLKAVPSDSMQAPTPCPDLTLGALIDHVGGFAKVFTASATKELGDLTGQPPDPRADNLEPDWRNRMATDLSALAEAWAAPDAWEGMTQAGGQELPGAMAGRIALDELVVHGWDIAQATNQRFDCEAVTLHEVEATVQQVRGGNDGDIPGLFGPVVPISDDADALERVLSLTGRPGWPLP